MNPDDVRNRFLQRIHRDLEGGGAKELAEYQELYPGHAALVAEEYKRLWDESPYEDDPPFDIKVVSEEFLSELRRNSSPPSRFEIQKELARGGMGAIHEVWDRGLDRQLAMKVILGDKELSARTAPPTRDPHKLARFIEEAQVTGRLDHPGVVPVHELGLNSQGDVYFTMRLIEGRDLREIFGLVRRGEEGWTRTRALNQLLRVCETMSFAHSKGVIHRDLKPSNIMVGRFGEVYVVDWGLAKMHGREDTRDLRLRPSAEWTDRSESGLLTMDGTVVGTPAYMPPEQALGNMGELGPHSDVYSMGAILYELLAGRRPYHHVERSPHAVLAALTLGPPQALHESDPNIPAELAAVCERAMAREPAGRYTDMQELAEDLRAFLEHRVVAAYETGSMAELRKWVRRNRGLSAALLGVVLFAFVGLAVSLFLKSQADANARQASDEKKNVLRLSAFQDLEDLIGEADSEAMWPIHPDKAPTYVDWLRRAESLVSGLNTDPATGTRGHRELREELRARVVLHTNPEGEEELQEVWWLAQLQKLVLEMEAFSEGEASLARNVRRRQEYAGSMRERTTSGAAASALWKTSSAYARSHLPYAGLELEPQLGLLPLGPDPISGWLEFAELQCGSVPHRGADGSLVIDEQTGLVFVLLPGSSFAMGSQSDDPDAANYFNPGDSAIEADETPVHSVTVGPFLISKYEMTQGQWLRFTGVNPSNYPPGVSVGGQAVGLRNPVEGVSWFEVETQLARLGVLLPTEAQWEYAARGGTTTLWSFGNVEERSADYSNVADDFGRANGPKGVTYEAWNDGWATHAPVGTYGPNPFGLHDVHGNVWEWCRDLFGKYTLPVSPDEAERIGGSSAFRPARGGCFRYTAGQTRSSNRWEQPPGVRELDIGLRPMRRLREIGPTAVGRSR